MHAYLSSYGERYGLGVTELGTGWELGDGNGGRAGRCCIRQARPQVGLYSCTGMAVGLRSTALKKGVLVGMRLVTNF